MSMPPRPTPETDAEEFPVMTWPIRDNPTVVRSTLSRKLERERDDAIDNFEGERERAEMLMVQRNVARDERDRLVEALRQVKAHDGPGFPIGTCATITDKALAAVKGGAQ